MDTWYVTALETWIGIGVDVGYRTDFSIYRSIDSFGVSDISIISVYRNIESFDISKYRTCFALLISSYTIDMSKYRKFRYIEISTAFCLLIYYLSIYRNIEGFDVSYRPRFASLYIIEISKVSIDSIDRVLPSIIESGPLQCLCAPAKNIGPVHTAATGTLFILSRCLPQWSIASVASRFASPDT